VSTIGHSFITPRKGGAGGGDGGDGEGCRGGGCGSGGGGGDGGGCGDLGGGLGLGGTRGASNGRGGSCGAGGDCGGAGGPLEQLISGTAPVRRPSECMKASNRSPRLVPAPRSMTSVRSSG